MPTNFPTVMNPNDLTAALAQSQVHETQGLAGFAFLKMDFDTGEWFLGQDAEDVTGEKILVNTPTIMHGWILWSGGRPNKNLVGFTQPLPTQMESIGEDHPSEARAFQAAMIDNGDPIAFDTNSYGGRKGTDVMLGHIKAHAAEGSKFLYPKVKLTSENYPGKNKRAGKTNHNPVFEIVSWHDGDGNEEPKGAAQVETQADDTPETEPPVKVKRKRRSRNSESAA